jgi:hypothetical protein
MYIREARLAMLGETWVLCRVSGLLLRGEVWAVFNCGKKLGQLIRLIECPAHEEQILIHEIISSRETGKIRVGAGFDREKKVMDSLSLIAQE